MLLRTHTDNVIVVDHIRRGMPCKVAGFYYFNLKDGAGPTGITTVSQFGKDMKCLSSEERIAHYTEEYKKVFGSKTIHTYREPT